MAVRKRHTWDRKIGYTTRRRACTVCGVTASTFGAGAGRTWHYKDCKGNPVGTRSPDCRPVLTVSGHTVRDHTGAEVARLWWGSGMARVTTPEGRTIGRLFAEGPDCYAPWTALHSAAPTPSDRQLAPASDIAAGVRILIEETSRAHSQ